MVDPICMMISKLFRLWREKQLSLDKLSLAEYELFEAFEAGYEKHLESNPSNKPKNDGNTRFAGGIPETLRQKKR